MTNDQEIRIFEVMSFLAMAAMVGIICFAIGYSAGRESYRVDGTITLGDRNLYDGACAFEVYTQSMKELLQMGILDVVKACEAVHEQG